MVSFNKNMEKSMQTLVGTFSDGMKTMNKLQTETNVVQGLYNKKNAQNVKQLEKVNSGIANLEALTSDLKQSFNDESQEKNNLPAPKA